MPSGKVFLEIIAVFLFSSCVRYDAQGPAYSTGHGLNNGNNNYPSPGNIGVIAGHIHLFDQYGSSVTTGLAGIQVTLSPYSVIAFTDSTGYYRFYNAPTGAYNLYVHDTAILAAFGDTKAFNVQLTGDSVVKDISLSAIPSFAPLSISATVDTSTKIDSVVLTFTADTRARSAIVFVNSNSAVNNLPANYLHQYTVSIPASASSVSLSIPATDLYNVGITSGSSVYLAVYGYVTTDYSMYKDYTTGKIVYTAVSSASMTTSVKAP